MNNTQINYLVLTWKPEINKEFKEPDFNALVSKSRKNGYVDTKWRFLSKNFNTNDIVLVIRQGKETGLIGFGHILLNESDVDADSMTHYSTVRLVNLRSTNEHPFLSKELLLNIGFRKSILETQASGLVTLSAEEISFLQTHVMNTYKKSVEDMCFG
jgi:hypothetical protein